MEHRRKDQAGDVVEQEKPGQAPRHSTAIWLDGQKITSASGQPSCPDNPAKHRLSMVSSSKSDKISKRMCMIIMILAIGQVTIEQRRAFAIALSIIAYVGTRGEVHVQSGAAIAPVASHVNGSTRGTDRTAHVFDHMCWAVQQVPGLQTRTPMNPPKKRQNLEAGKSGYPYACVVCMLGDLEDAQVFISDISECRLNPLWEEI